MPTFADVLGVATALLFVCCCAWQCVNLLGFIRDVTVTTERRRDDRYVSMSSRGEATTEDEENPMWIVPEVEFKTEHPVARCAQRYGTLCCISTAVAATITCIILLARFPHYPKYEICNTDLDWSSVFNALARFSLQAEYDVVVSVYNPNQFDAGVDEMGANFLFNEKLVATARHMDAVQLPASTV